MTLDADRNIVSYDIEKQCRAVFENVRLVLEDSGATWNDIVDVTVFLTNMKKISRSTTASTRNILPDLANQIRRARQLKSPRCRRRSRSSSK